MSRTFPETLSQLRRSRNISQRRAAAELNISQALLSHYENGVREPGLNFVCRACDYYSVSADYLLCRSDEPDSVGSIAGEGREFLARMKNIIGSAEAALDKIEEKA
ncbi:MAG: helix-turn-helix domain-containing protein [Candidatus Limivicinus sp.]